MFAITCYVSYAYIQSYSRNHFLVSHSGRQISLQLYLRLSSFMPWTLNVLGFFLPASLNNIGTCPSPGGCKPQNENPVTLVLQPVMGAPVQPTLSMSLKADYHSYWFSHWKVGYRARLTRKRGEVYFIQRLLNCELCETLISVRNNWILCLEPVVWSQHLEDHTWLILSVLAAEMKLLKEV